MSAYFKDITANFYTAKGLWLPELTDRFWSHRYAAVTVPINLHADEPGSYTSHTGFFDALTLDIAYPIDIDVDDTWRVLGARLSITLIVEVDGPDFSNSVTVRFKTDSETSSTLQHGTSSGSNPREHTITKTYATLPTGSTSEVVEIDDDDDADIKVWRKEANTAQALSSTELPVGPSCYFEIYEV